MSPSPPPFSRLPPEFQLACLCCRPQPTEHDRNEMRRLLAMVSVPAFADLVLTRHRIGPLVHAAFKALGRHALPADLDGALAAEARMAAIKSLAAQRTIALLARRFAAAGIDWLPFKGILVAQRYYGNLALRQVNDLDIWVPASALQQARSVLAQAGFHADAKKWLGDLCARGPRHANYLNWYFVEEQHCSDEQGGLDLHWQLTNNPGQFRLVPQDLLRRAQRLEMGGEQVPMMDDVDLLLYLCEHGAAHAWFRLKWLADLPRLLAHHEWDWSTVFARAAQAGCTRTLLLGLALCQEYFGWVPPEPVAQRLQAMRSLPLVLRLVRSAMLAPGSVYAPNVRLPLGRYLMDRLKSLLLSGNLASGLVHLRRLALSPNDLRVLQLPDRWFALYYPLRPLLLTARLWRK